MTEQKHLKALIRARMVRTGEAYTAARRHLVASSQPPVLTALTTFLAHDRHCMTAVFTPDDRHILSGGFGGQARVWTLDGESVGALEGHTASVNVVRIAPDGRTAVTAASDKSVRLWDLADRRLLAVLGTHKRQVLALDLDADRDRIWSGGHDGRLQAWSVGGQELVGSYELGGAVTSVAVRPADGAVAATTVGAGISVRSIDGAEIVRLARDAEVTTAVTWAGDGSFLLASGSSGATIWESEDWSPVRTLESGSGVLPVALSPDGSRIALGWDNHVALWSADESQAPATMAGLPKGVYGLAFSSDGRRLALAAADGRVRTFTVA